MNQHKVSFPFNLSDNLVVMVEASARWVSPYNAEGLYIELKDMETEEVIDDPIPVNVYEEIEELAIEMLFTKTEDEKEVDF